MDLIPQTGKRSGYVAEADGGLAAANTTVGGSTTYTLGLGTYNQVYLSAGRWTAYPPTFTVWVKVS